MSPFPFTIQAAKLHITTTHLTVQLKANIAHHQMATSYDNKEIIIGGYFYCTFVEISQINLFNKECTK